MLFTHSVASPLLPFFPPASPWLSTAPPLWGIPTLAHPQGPPPFKSASGGSCAPWRRLAPGLLRGGGAAVSALPRPPPRFNLGDTYFSLTSRPYALRIRFWGLLHAVAAFGAWLVTRRRGSCFRPTQASTSLQLGGYLLQPHLKTLRPSNPLLGAPARRSGVWRPPCMLRQGGFFSPCPGPAPHLYSGDIYFSTTSRPPRPSNPLPGAPARRGGVWHPPCTRRRGSSFRPHRACSLPCSRAPAAPAPCLAPTFPPRLRSRRPPSVRACATAPLPKLAALRPRRPPSAPAPAPDLHPPLPPCFTTPPFRRLFAPLFPFISA
ncbi:hypothetical protein B0H11DRAFT_2237143 [Mycena galericulata]|nr:hypothetical protein B0H11DRAFT_2237143 [Mycena galericulata]